MDMTYNYKAKKISNENKKEKNFILRELEKNKILLNDYIKLRIFFKDICQTFNSKRMQVNIF